MAGERRTIPASVFCSSVRDGTHDSPKPVSVGRFLVTSRHITGGRLDLASAYLISQEDFDDINKRSKVERWDVLLSMIGTVGEPCLVKDDPTFAIKNIGLFKSNGEYEGKWLYYYLRSPHAQQIIREQSRGTTQAYIPLGALRDFPVVVPNDPKEMQAIACILGALDDKIELNRRMNRTLEGLARAIFQSWFVDFAPVRAKAAGRTPAGLAPSVAALFPAGFEKSELGEIPKGWRVGAIDEVAEINVQTLGRGDSLEIIDYIEISEVMRGEVATVTRYSRGDEPSRARRRLRHGDTALSTVRPDRGAYFLCLEPPDSLIASTGFAVFTSRIGHWGFLYAMLTRKEIGEELGRLADGGAYPAVRPEVIGKLPVVVPRDTRVIEAYDGLAQPLLQRSAVNRRESRALAALRDALLPKLISGELRVPDAERIAGRCV
jgi:type I restriction enzyme, S subunit